MHSVVLGIIEKFPSFDLQSDEGIDAAIKDMETKLGDVATSDEVSDS